MHVSSSVCHDILSRHWILNGKRGVFNLLLSVEDKDVWYEVPENMRRRKSMFLDYRGATASPLQCHCSMFSAQIARFPFMCSFGVEGAIVVTYSVKLATLAKEGIHSNLQSRRTGARLMKREQHRRPSIAADISLSGLF